MPGIDFNLLTPPVSVTNPDSLKPSALLDREYPRHLHRADGTYIIVGDDLAKAREQANGWYLTEADHTAAIAQAAAAVAVSDEADTASKSAKSPKAAKVA